MFDHIRPLAQGGSDGPDNIQALCATPCHSDKSKAEHLTFFASAFYSELSTDVLEGLLDAPKPQQLVFGDGALGCLELDVIKCRRWAIEKAEAPLPVACVLDRIEPFSEGAGAPDFIFVDAGPPDTTDYAHYAAHQGPRWYTRELAQWLLDAKTQNGSGEVITADRHFIASFTATDYVEPDRLRAMYQGMEAAVMGALDGKSADGFSLEGCDAKTIADEAHKKQAFLKSICLAMQGSWLTQHTYSWKCVGTTHRDDVPRQVHTFRALPGHQGVCRYMVQAETMSNRTMYFFGLYALSREHLLVCMAIRMTRQVGCAIHGILVDGVLIKGAETAKKHLEKEARRLKRPNGTELFRVKKDWDYKIVTKDAPDCSPHTRQCSALCHASAWRPSDFTADNEQLWSRFGADVNREGFALGSWLYEPRFLFERHWRTLEEEEGIGSKGADDAFQEEAARAVSQNGRGLVTGRGGVGKSHHLTLLKKGFVAAKFWVDVVAFTHVQSASVDGDTVLHDIYQNLLRKRRVLITDEGGQVPIRIWAVIATLKYIGCKIVVLGDFAVQLCPIADQNRIGLWKRLPHSDFMHDLCEGLHVKLQKFRRGGDYGHLSFVGRLNPIAGDNEDAKLGTALQAAREEYPVRHAE